MSNQKEQKQFLQETFSNIETEHVQSKMDCRIHTEQINLNVSVKRKMEKTSQMKQLSRG